MNTAVWGVVGAVALLLLAGLGVAVAVLVGAFREMRSQSVADAPLPKDGGAL